MDSIVHRNLDGYYFRVKRNGKVDNYCWSDMTQKERYEVIDRFDIDSLKRFCVGLGDVIRDIGDQLDLVLGKSDYEE